MPVNFNNVISNLINPNITSKKWAAGNFIGNVLCPDCYFGTINNGIFTRTNRLGTMPQNITNNAIIIIAESPHVKEFNSSNKTANFPLMNCKNRIGNKIFLKIKSLGINLNNNGYDVYLVNAIQYQCSLGNSPLCSFKNQSIRNEVFSFTWNTENAYDDLIDRIKLILNYGYNASGSILLNCCTKNLKSCCDSNSIQIGTGVKTYDLNHPSRW